MKNNKVYVISKMFKDGKCYLVSENAWGVGSFSLDIVAAKKFLNKMQAEIWASGYEGATVEVLKEGEKLK